MTSDTPAGYHRDEHGAIWPDACTCGGRIGAYCLYCNPTPDIDLDRIKQEIEACAPEFENRNRPWNQSGLTLVQIGRSLLSALTATRAEAAGWEKRYAEMLGQRDTALQEVTATRAELETARAVAQSNKRAHTTAFVECERLTAQLAEVRRLCDNTIWILNANDVRAVLDAAPQPACPGHCGLCGREDCPGVPGKGCTPGPFEDYEPFLPSQGRVVGKRRLIVTTRRRDPGLDTHALDDDEAAVAGDGEQDTATCGPDLYWAAEGMACTVVCENWRGTMPAVVDRVTPTRVFVHAMRDGRDFGHEFVYRREDGRALGGRSHGSRLTATVPAATASGQGTAGEEGTA